MKKNLLWTLLVMILIGSFLLVGCGSSEEEDAAKIITFGEYPQTIKAANVTVTESDGVWLGSDGAYYAKVTAKPYKDGYTFSDGTVITSGEDYYFKYEPIEWRVLSEEDGTALILSEKILDARRFFDGDYTIENGKYYIKGKSGKTINNYSYSSIRSFLKGPYYIASAYFTDAEEARIVEKLITGDKAFLLEESEVKSGWYGFQTDNSADKARIKKTTDYSRAMGAMIVTESDSYGAGSWWLGSTHALDKEVANALQKNGFSSEAKSEEAAIVNEKGACEGKYVKSKEIGVVPAMKITIS